VDQETHDLIRYAQALLGHAVPSGDLPEVIHRAFAALVAQLERRKFAKTERPRANRYTEDARHIPAGVKRAVWERDGGRCTFVGENGHRCESRARLEFDHVEPVANGGHATVKGLRLRCRAHNQLEAERHFGRDFMHAKRDDSPRPATGAA
jgi:5-methylcytosine-specific restriction endonuclease McrA